MKDNQIILQTSPMPTLDGIQEAIARLGGEGFILCASPRAYPCAKEAIAYKATKYSKAIFDFVVLERMPQDDDNPHAWKLVGTRGEVYSKGDGSVNYQRSANS